MVVSKIFGSAQKVTDVPVDSPSVIGSSCFKGAVGCWSMYVWVQWKP